MPLAHCLVGLRIIHIRSNLAFRSLLKSSKYGSKTLPNYPEKEYYIPGMLGNPGLTSQSKTNLSSNFHVSASAEKLVEVNGFMRFP